MKVTVFDCLALEQGVQGDLIGIIGGHQIWTKGLLTNVVACETWD